MFGLQTLSIAMHSLLRTPGIEAIAVEIPYDYINLKELERHDNELNKYTQGLRMNSLSVPSSDDNVITLAEKALLKLFRLHSLDPTDIGRLEVATESMIDRSKSIKSCLMKHMNSSTNIEGTDVYHACYSGTSALFSALEWIHGPWWNGKKAIVICTDIAVWEPSLRFMNGAGAVAILVSSTGGLVIEPYRSTFCQNQYDFYKPLNMPYPIVQGSQSLKLFTSCLEHCLDQLPSNIISESNYWVFHCASVLNSVKAAKIVTNYLSLSPDQFDEIYLTKVKPSTNWISHSGSLFTASLFVGLANLLYNNTIPIGSTILLYAFGSGVMATLYRAKLNSVISIYPLGMNKKKRKKKFLIGSRKHII